MSLTRKTEPLTAIIFAYLALISVLPFRRLPFVGSGLQLPEFILLAGLGWLLWQWRTVLSRRFLVFDAAVLAYLLVNGLSAWQSGRGACWQEFGLRVYLALVYVVFRHWVATHAEPERSRVLFAATWWMGVVAALTGLVGLVLAWTGVSERFAYFSPNYPYLGDVWRAKGMVGKPNLLNIILLTALFFQLVQLWADGWRLSRRALIFFGLVLPAILLTFSKSMLYLPLALALLAGLRQPRWRIGWWALALAICAFVQFGTNFVVLPNTPAGREKVRTELYFSGRIAAQTEHYLLAETNYVATKRAALILGNRHPALGVGPGAHVLNIAPLQSEGLYPAHMERVDSHCALLGAYSETGAAGLAAFLALWGLAGWMCYRLWQQGHAKEPLFQALFIGLVVLALDGISADTMNFRHLWVLFGLLAGLYESTWRRPAEPQSGAAN